MRTLRNRAMRMRNAQRRLVAASEPSPPSNIKFTVGAETFNTSSGTTQDFAAGFAETPKGALFTHAYNTVSGTIVNDSGNSVSFSDGTGQGAIACRAEDGQATTDAQYYKNSAYVAAVADENGSAVVSRATASMLAGNTRLTWATSGAPSDYLGGVFHMGGDDMSVEQWNGTVSMSQNSTFNITGLAFAPDVMIAISGPSSGGSGFMLSDNMCGIGFAVRGGNQGSCVFRGRNNQATSSMAAYISNEWAQTALSTTAARGLEVTSWNSDGVTLTARGAGYSHAEFFLFLKLACNADAAVEIIDWPNSTGEQSYNTGFRPRAVLMAGTHLSTLNTYANADTGLALSFIDGATQVCSAGIDAHGVGTSESHAVHTTKALKVPQPDGTTWWEADFTGFDATGFKLDFTTVHTTLRKAVALAFR